MMNKNNEIILIISYPMKLSPLHLIWFDSIALHLLIIYILIDHKHDQNKLIIIDLWFNFENSSSSEKFWTFFLKFWHFSRRDKLTSLCIKCTKVLLRHVLAWPPKAWVVDLPSELTWPPLGKILKKIMPFLYHCV